jgi:hypothetical protein
MRRWTTLTTYFHSLDPLLQFSYTLAEDFVFLAEGGTISTTVTVIIVSAHNRTVGIGKDSATITDILFLTHLLLLFIIYDTV